MNHKLCVRPKWLGNWKKEKPQVALPIGTLTANILAGCIMAALATISKEMNIKMCGIIVSSIQFGFLGCLSTVSSFVAEILAMRQSVHILRANVYMLLTIIPSFIFSFLS